MINDVLSELSEGIESAYEALKRDLSKLRTGRAHAGMLDNIRVDYYGQSTVISQLATVSVPESRLLTVKPWDKSQMKAVDKAIREGGLGFNPQMDGELIRIPIPPLSEERRKELVKVARNHGRESKVAIRHSRHEALDMLDEIKKDGGASQDDVDRAKKKAEEIVSQAGQTVDSIVQRREGDILEV